MEIGLIIALVIVLVLAVWMVLSTRKDGERRYTELKGEKELQIEELKNAQQEAMTEKVKLQQENDMDFHNNAYYIYLYAILHLFLL